MKIKFVTSFVLACIVSGASALAEQGGDFPPPGPGAMGMMQGPLMMPNMQKLNLSAEQKSKISAIHREKRSQIESMRTEIDSKRDSFHALLAGNASDSEIRKSHDEMQALHAKMAAIHFDTFLAIRSVLTPEQRKEMMLQMDKRKEFRGDMHGGKGMGQGMGQGMGKGMGKDVPSGSN